jgi:hypothetical protein
MRLSLHNLRPRLPRPRKWASLGAVALAASVMTAVLPGSASAQTDTYIYLAHETDYGMYAASGVTLPSYIELTTPPWGSWQVNSYGQGTVDGISGSEYEFEAITTSGSTAPDLCLTTTQDGGPAGLGPCGKGGTVFILESNDGGYIMYSRYFLNLGEKVALATEGYGNGKLVYAYDASSLGTGVYYRWAFTDL